MKISYDRAGRPMTHPLSGAQLPIGIRDVHARDKDRVSKMSATELVAALIGESTNDWAIWEVETRLVAFESERELRKTTVIPIEELIGSECDPAEE